MLIAIKNAENKIAWRYYIDRVLPAHKRHQDLLFQKPSQAANINNIVSHPYNFRNRYKLYNKLFIHMLTFF